MGGCRDGREAGGIGPGSRRERAGDYRARGQPEARLHFPIRWLRDDVERDSEPAAAEGRRLREDEAAAAPNNP